MAGTLSDSVKTEKKLFPLSLTPVAEKVAYGHTVWGWFFDVSKVKEWSFFVNTCLIHYFLITIS